ncbi:RNA-pol-Rpc4 domain containing protein [Pyrenophora tritici-repentis]|nr:RNA-pol-Rpc4 domain containing protein [Pyrenophora tritici-repentis]
MAPRGQSSTRARGSARGGANAARPSASDATPQTTATDQTAEQVESDSKPAVTGEGITTTTESQASVQAGTSTETSVCPPAQRLGSLQGSVPPSRSASPAVRGRGGTSRGKRGVKLPSFTGRRSKEERDAMVQEQAARDRERTKEQIAADEKKRRDMEYARKREDKRKNFRGGYSGVATGPFSLGNRKNNSRPGYSGFGSGFGSGSGSRAERVKNEDGSYGGSGHQSTRGGGGSSTKREDGGLVSSEEEEEDTEVHQPRMNIDELKISSDDFAGKAPEPTSMAQLPVRAGRKEHQERKPGYNTEASTAKVLEQAEGKTPKLKSESKEVKVEGGSDDETMSDAGKTGLPDAPALKQDPSVEHRPKPKTTDPAQPAFQTDDDRAEWERIQLHRRLIIAEFGPTETPEVDSSGDAVMAGTAEKPTVRTNNVYLFQIPPLMPEVEASIKKEAPDPKPEAKIKLEEGGFSDPTAKPTSVRFGSGLVGKLRVHKSGRTTLDWGGTSFEVTDVRAGSGSRQEVVSMEFTPENQRSAPEDAGDAYSLGPVKGKFVVTPDLETMFK